MSKLIKRLVASCMALMLGMTCMTPISMAANLDNLSDNSVLYLEYNEYIASQDYFTSLAKNGYTLIVHVGEENEQAELERIASEADGSPDLMQPSRSRELNIPTYKYNVLENGKKTISGSCDYNLGYLFTNYIYYGCSAYEVSLYTRGDDTLEVDLVPEDEIIEFLSYEVPPESTVIKYVTEYSWYGRFRNPCSVYGYVKRDV